MILLVLVAVLWVVVLAPSVYGALTERGGVGSIDHFHHQLELLEHAGPKLVSPAYRLHASGPGGASPVPVAAESTTYRAKLVLLRPVDDEQSADIDDLDGAHYERVGVLEPPRTGGQPPPTRRPNWRLSSPAGPPALHPVLRSSPAVASRTGLLGVVPSLRVAWILTASTGSPSWPSSASSPTPARSRRNARQTAGLGRPGPLA